MSLTPALASIIADRTSSSDVVSAVTTVLERYPELSTVDDHYDATFAKNGVVRSLTDWTAAVVREQTKAAYVALSADPLGNAEGILDLMTLISKRKRSAPAEFDARWVSADEREVMRFACGAAITELVTREAVIREMEKAGTEFFYRSHSREPRQPEPLPSRFLMLREVSGTEMAVLETRGDVLVGMVLRDSLGRESHPARSYVIGFVKDRGLSLLTPTTIPDVVRLADGSFYHVTGIPNGSVIDGDFELYDRYPDLKFLPDALTVNGDMCLCQNQVIEMLPWGLNVKGRLTVEGCPALSLLRNRIKVGGDARFFRCGRLGFVGKDCAFMGDLHVDHVRLLRQKFTLGGRAFMQEFMRKREIAYPIKGLWNRWVKAA